MYIYISIYINLYYILRTSERSRWRCPKIGLTPVTIHFERWDFPLTKPSSYWVPPWRAENPHMEPQIPQGRTPGVQKGHHHLQVWAASGPCVHVAWPKPFLLPYVLPSWMLTCIYIYVYIYICYVCIHIYTYIVSMYIYIHIYIYIWLQVKM